jgi:hypothetical protein
VPASITDGSESTTKLVMAAPFHWCPESPHPP